MITVPILLASGAGARLQHQPGGLWVFPGTRHPGDGLGYIAWLWLIENVGSVRASMVTYIVPVIAVILGWIVLDESIGLNTIAGGLLIVSGVATVMRGQSPPARESTRIVPAGVAKSVSAD